MPFLNLAIFLILIASQAVAQVVIRPRDIPSIPGTVLTYYYSSDTANGIEVDVGEGGENRHWDFSGYAFDEVSNDTLIDPEEAPEHETYPDANRVIISPSNELGIQIGTGGIQYEAVTDTGWYMFGVVGGFGEIQLPFEFPAALKILPLPAEYEDEWDIAARFEIGMVAPDTLLEGLLDSIYIRVAIGGFSSIDGWGVVTYSGGDLPAIRQHISVGGNLSVVGTFTLFGRRMEQEVFRQDIQTNQTYRWLSPAMGEIARMTSMLGEADPDFNRASSIRVRRVVPDLAFPDPPLAFGLVHVGNSGVAQFRIRNSGEGVGSVSRVIFSGGLENEIEVINELPMVIEPDSSALLRCLWSPTVEKSLWPNTITITHNDPGMENPLVVTLQGATPDFASVEPDAGRLPSRLSLVSVSPNPFNSSATIRFELPLTGFTTLTIVDLNGKTLRTIATGVMLAGTHQLTLHEDQISTGVYLITLETAGQRVVTSAVYLK